MVTNPATRDWTVTASLFATLNEMFGNRTVCGIGRGDSAVRVTNGKPTTLATLREAIHVIRELANGREADYNGASRFGSRGAPEPSSRCGSPPTARKALALTGEVGDGFILQLADPDIAEWTIGPCARRPSEAGRDPDEVKICVAAPAYVGRRPASTCATSAAGSAGWSATTSPTSCPLRRASAGVPTALTDYIKGREGYDYNEHGRAGNTHTAFVPDEIVDRFCLLGPISRHVERLQELQALGVDQFAMYLQHDHKPATLEATARRSSRLSARYEARG